jgi:hypothetical protein
MYQGLLGHGVLRVFGQCPEIPALVAGQTVLVQTCPLGQEPHTAELEALRRALLVAFPPKAPRAVALVDVAAHQIVSFVDEELDVLRARLAEFDLIGAVDVRALLRGLDVDASTLRLAELGPPQKTKKLNQRGRTLKITTELLVQGSCGIGKPFGDPKKLAAYLDDGQTSRLRRRLEADAKSLFALFQYSRLHGCVRLRWGFLDEQLPAPWVHHDETTLYKLKEAAAEAGQKLEVVVGGAPGWKEPWARARTVRIHKEPAMWGHDLRLVDDQGYFVEEEDIQLARLLSGPTA